MLNCETISEKSAVQNISKRAILAFVHFILYRLRKVVSHVNYMSSQSTYGLVGRERLMRHVFLPYEYCTLIIIWSKGKKCVYFIGYTASCVIEHFLHVHSHALRIIAGHTLTLGCVY